MTKRPGSSVLPTRLVADATTCLRSFGEASISDSQGSYKCARDACHPTAELGMTSHSNPISPFRPPVAHPMLCLLHPTRYGSIIAWSTAAVEQYVRPPSNKQGGGYR